MCRFDMQCVVGLTYVLWAPGFIDHSVYRRGEHTGRRPRTRRGHELEQRYVVVWLGLISLADIENRRNSTPQQLYVVCLPASTYGSCIYRLSDLQARNKQSLLSWAERQTGAPHAPEWIATCKREFSFTSFSTKVAHKARLEVDGEIIGTGTGLTKAAAKDAAATEALKALESEAPPDSQTEGDSHPERDPQIEGDSLVEGDSQVEGDPQIAGNSQTEGDWQTMT